MWQRRLPYWALVAQAVREYQESARAALLTAQATCVKYDNSLNNIMYCFLVILQIFTRAQHGTLPGLSTARLPIFATGVWQAPSTRGQVKSAACTASTSVFYLQLERYEVHVPSTPGLEPGRLEGSGGLEGSGRLEGSGGLEGCGLEGSGGAGGLDSWRA